MYIKFQHVTANCASKPRALAQTTPASALSTDAVTNLCMLPVLRKFLDLRCVLLVKNGLGHCFVSRVPFHASWHVAKNVPVWQIQLVVTPACVGSALVIGTPNCGSGTPNCGAIFHTKTVPPATMGETKYPCRMWTGPLFLTVPLACTVSTVLHQG